MKVCILLLREVAKKKIVAFSTNLLAQAWTLKNVLSEDKPTPTLYMNEGM